ncbi:hypothetical protein ILUMI_23683, partial [Ignelater luminosus]
MFYSGVPRYERARGGVAFMVSNNLVNNVVSWRFISEKLMVLVWNVWGEDKAIIATYRPNEDTTVAEKDQSSISSRGPSTSIKAMSWLWKILMEEIRVQSRKRHGTRYWPLFSGSQTEDVGWWEGVREEFVQAVEQERANQAEVVELWEAFKQVLLEVACGKSRVNKRREKRTKWWNNE